MTKHAFLPLLFGFSLCCFSQQSLAQVSIGLRGGGLSAMHTQDPVDADPAEYKRKWGVQIAIPVEIRLSKHFAIQPEIMYGRHGGRQVTNKTGAELGLTSTASYREDYDIKAFEIPVLAKYGLENDHFMLHFVAGPSFGLNSTAAYKHKTRVTITNSTGSWITEAGRDENFTGVFVKDGYDGAKMGANEFAISRTNWNVHLGGMVGLKIGSAKAFVDLRYILGLSDFSPEAHGTAPEEAVTIKSNRIGVSVGVMFAL